MSTSESQRASQGGVVEHRLTALETDCKAIRSRLHDLSGEIHNVGMAEKLTQKHLEQQDKQLKKIEDNVGEIKTVVVGDGTDGCPGLGHRIGAVERTVNGWVKACWMIGGAVLALVANFVRGLIGGAR